MNKNEIVVSSVFCFVVAAAHSSYCSGTLCAPGCHLAKHIYPCVCVWACVRECGYLFVIHSSLAANLRAHTQHQCSHDSRTHTQAKSIESNARHTLVWYYHSFSVAPLSYLSLSLWRLLSRSTLEYKLLYRWRLLQAIDDDLTFRSLFQTTQETYCSGH